MSSQPFSPSRCLALAIRNAGLEKAANDTYFTSPHLKEVAVSFSRFVSPYIEVNGKSVLEMGVTHALKSYRKLQRENHPAAERAYISSLARQVVPLCHLRMSVKSQDGAWAIWCYEEPLFDWMLQHRRKSVLVRLRDRPIDATPVLIKMLAAICTVRDLQMAEFDVSQLIQALAA